VFFPLPVYYILFLGLAWLVWRRGRLDREEKRFWLLISIAGIWASVLVGLILNKDLSSLYGQQVLVESTFICIAASGIVFLAYLLWPVGGGAVSDRERQDFRSGIAAETYSILKKFTDPLNHRDINHPIWSNKAPQSQAAILDKEDYLVLQSFYDAIDERNKHFALRTGGFDLTKLGPLNRTCVETLSRAYGGVTWLKTESDTDTLLSRARKSVGLSESPLETINASPPQIMPEITIQSASNAKQLAPKVHTGRPFGEARLDPRYEHVQLHVFWPLHYSIPRLSRWLGYTKDIYTESDLLEKLKVMYVINRKTKNAFSVGSYVWEEFLFPFKRIEMNSHTKWFPFYSNLWLRKHGFHAGDVATPTDLLEGSNLMPLGSTSLVTRDKEVDMKRQQDRLRLVYEPLHNLILVLPKGLTVGTTVNDWSLHPERIREVVRIFTDYHDLIENEDVWIGWRRNEDDLSKDKFWLKDDAYKWFDSIESEYKRLKLLLREFPSP
jgi:hypothetical protein